MSVVEPLEKLTEDTYLCENKEFDKGKIVRVSDVEDTLLLGQVVSTTEDGEKCVVQIKR